MWALTLGIALSPTWRLLEYHTLDWLMTLAPPGTRGSPVVIVAIDEPSFAELGIPWPWPRDVHARLIDRLAEAGARVIAFDVVFAEAGLVPGADERFAEAITRARNVVLAGDESVMEGPHLSGRIRTEPLPLLVKAGARTGLITLPLEGDGVVRRMPHARDAFWREVLAAAAPAPARPADPRPGFIRYRGRDHTFLFVSYYQALDPRRFLPPGLFRDRIVLVGRDGGTPLEPRARQPDAFLTPMLGLTGSAMPGVEIHASAVETGRLDDAVREIPGWLALSVTAAALAAAWAAMRGWQPVRGAIVAAALAVVIAGSALVLFQWARWWLPPLAPLLGIVLAYLGQGGVAFAREQGMRVRIRRAFGYYVASEVIDQMIANPERLVLGGERRELTVLFADLAGFTSLSEQRGPEEVVGALNRFLTDVTRVVLAHGGTVDKFIGDCVMALWGAPLPDPDHALHACEAAAAMQAAVSALRAEFIATWHSPVSMRIGIHTGVAVVGNMGSDTRFDYTAVGDDVNLASRLEGVNKAYGTDILLSAATADRVKGRFAVRLVGTVRVVGRDAPVDVFTPLAHPAIEQPSQEGVCAYREQRWDDAVRAWQDVLARVPGDRVATLYLERIAQARRLPPRADWDGTDTLDHK